MQLLLGKRNAMWFAGDPSGPGSHRNTFVCRNSDGQCLHISPRSVPNLYLPDRILC